MWNREGERERKQFSAVLYTNQVPGSRCTLTHIGYLTCIHPTASTMKGKLHPLHRSKNFTACTKLSMKKELQWTDIRFPRVGDAGVDLSLHSVKMPLVVVTFCCNTKPQTKHTDHTYN